MVNGGITPLEEFAGCRKQWLYTKSVRQSQTDDGNGHGTCEASLITGHEFGVAKKQHLYIVKTDIKDQSSVEEAVDLITTELKRNPSPQQKVVISLAFGAPGFDPDNRFPLTGTWKRMQTKLKYLATNLNALIVAAPGNKGQRILYMDEMPALALDGVENGLVAPGVWFDGNRAPGSQMVSPALKDRIISIAAPATVECAYPYGGSGREDGTSFSTAIMAGFLAYLIGAGMYDDTKSLRQQLEGAFSLARSSLDPQLRSVWNTEDGSLIKLQSNESAAVDVS